MIDHSEMLETILKRLNDMTMHSPRHDYTTELHQEEDTASKSQISVEKDRIVETYATGVKGDAN